MGFPQSLPIWQGLLALTKLCSQETLEVPKLTLCSSCFVQGEEKNFSVQINILEEELVHDSPTRRPQHRSLPARAALRNGLSLRAAPFLCSCLS
jgi:hypothetical protein